jgi:hypothetical protein
LNLRMFVIRHWKAVVLAVSIGLFVLSIVAKAHADPIDSPLGP